MTHKLSTTVSDEFHDLRQEFNISWAEALRIGLAILFLERGVEGFKNPLNRKRVEFLLDKLNVMSEAND